MFGQRRVHLWRLQLITEGIDDIIYGTEHERIVFISKRGCQQVKNKFNILQQVVLEKRTVLEQITIIILQISQTASG